MSREKTFDQDFLWFVGKLKELTKIDFFQYRLAQVERRVRSMMFRKKVRDYREFYELLKSDRKEIEELLNHLAINYTEFFRNPEVYNALQTRIFPELVKKVSSLTVWSAACSSGEEPYSIAMILEDMRAKYRIYASDIDTDALAVAKRGIYEAKRMEPIPERWKSRYFRRVGGDTYEVVSSIKNKIVFLRQDIINDPPPAKKFEVIFCRNVMIYFKPELQQKVLRKFYGVLWSEGYLVLGMTEGYIATISGLFRKALPTGLPIFKPIKPTGGGRQVRGRTL